jgi:amino acid permease
MSAETVSLGVLSLSSATAAVGIVPMAIVILFMSLATVFSGIVLWQVKSRHPTVRSYGDIGQLMLGKPGRWVAEIQVFLLLIFIMAGHVNIFSTMANQIALAAGHSWQCTVAFKVVATVLSMALNLFRKFKSNTWTAMACELLPFISLWYRTSS